MVSDVTCHSAWLCFNCVQNCCATSWRYAGVYSRTDAAAGVVASEVQSMAVFQLFTTC
jgi:hypothetical protein